ncbi:hypothetical protein CRYUN_Cryun35bG0017700 [Craigia yunnanensis]
MASASETLTPIFYVPPHKLRQFLEESSPIFGDSRQRVIARELTKIHEEAVKLVAEGTSKKKKMIYSLVLRKFAKKIEAEDSN